MLGRDWLYEIQLNWGNIFTIKKDNQRMLNVLLTEFEEIFGSDLDLLKGEKANKIHLKENAQPKFCKARPIPYAQKQKVETELDRLVREGILNPVDVSEWATPIAPIKKADNSLRLCGDYKITVNRESKLDHYPIPKVEDLFAEMAGCTTFTKLDLSHAYQQIELEDESQEYLTLNTHRGLYRPTRLAFGVKSATGIFQRAIEKRLKGIPNTVVKIDDILVGGSNPSDKIVNLRKVFTAIRQSGLWLKKEKCVFMKYSVIYLGMEINRHGISPVADKIKAILESFQHNKEPIYFNSFMMISTKMKSYFRRMRFMEETMKIAILRLAVIVVASRRIMKEEIITTVQRM